MTDHPPLLSVALLEELAARWRAAGLPILGRLRPGLSGPQMDALTVPLGIRLPYEARVWWGWRDGVDVRSDPHLAGERLVTRIVQYLPLAEAVELYSRMRLVAAQAAEDIEPWRPEIARQDHFWAPSLFPIAHEAGSIVCDCSIEGPRPTPIRWLEPSEMAQGTPAPKARSFGEMVTWWIDAWDRELWTYLPDQQRWVSHDERRTDQDNRRRLV